MRYVGSRSPLTPTAMTKTNRAVIVARSHIGIEGSLGNVPGRTIHKAPAISAIIPRHTHHIALTRRTTLK